MILQHLFRVLHLEKIYNKIFYSSGAAPPFTSVTIDGYAIKRIARARRQIENVNTMNALEVFSSCSSALGKNLLNLKS